MLTTHFFWLGAFCWRPHAPLLLASRATTLFVELVSVCTIGTGWPNAHRLSKVVHHTHATPTVADQKRSTNACHDPGVRL